LDVTTSKDECTWTRVTSVVLGVRDSESCWFTEEIGTYMCCWESLGDLPFVIEIFVPFRLFCTDI
jgi:hypothetical protein